MPFRVVSGVGLRNCILGGNAQWRHLANTFERLCTAAVSGLPLEVSARPVAKLLLTILLTFVSAYRLASQYFLIDKAMH